MYLMHRAPGTPVGLGGSFQKVGTMLRGLLRFGRTPSRQQQPPGTPGVVDLELQASGGGGAPQAVLQVPVGYLGPLQVRQGLGQPAQSSLPAAAAASGGGVSAAAVVQRPYSGAAGSGARPASVGTLSQLLPLPPLPLHVLHGGNGSGGVGSAPPFPLQPAASFEGRRSLAVVGPQSLDGSPPGHVCSTRPAPCAAAPVQQSTATRHPPLGVGVQGPMVSAPDTAHLQASPASVGAEGLRGAVHGQQPVSGQVVINMTRLSGPPSALMVQPGQVTPGSAASAGVGDGSGLGEQAGCSRVDPDERSPRHTPTHSDHMPSSPLPPDCMPQASPAQFK